MAGSHSAAYRTGLSCAKWARVTGPRSSIRCESLDRADNHSVVDPCASGPDCRHDVMDNGSVLHQVEGAMVPIALVACLGRQLTVQGSLDAAASRSAGQISLHG